MIDLCPTTDLHTRLGELVRREPAEVADALRLSSDTLQQGGARFERSQALRPALSALLLSYADVQALKTLAESLHRVVEQAIDWVLEDDARFERHFAAHERMRPHFARTRGLDTWQGYSRYDAVVTPEGDVKLIELNTCCPAGFLHASVCNEATRRSFGRLGVSPAGSGLTSASLETGALIDALLEIESASGLAPGAVALLNDENGLQNELDQFRAEFERRGRRVVQGHARDVACEAGAAWLDGERLSLSFNKVRVSTPHSPNHRWAPGFEQRYAGFLEATRTGTFASVNNLVAATVGEDKSLLQLLHLPDFQAELDPADRRLIADHVLWTAALRPGPTVYRGETIDLLAVVREQPERFVIKPANEGRGFGVRVGGYCSAEDWADACCPPPELPCVVQEYAQPATLPVAGADDPSGEPLPVFLTIALGLIRGRYRGVFSRVSPDPVTNVGRAGAIQAVFQTGSG